jgi:hypothetical protein
MVTSAPVPHVQPHEQVAWATAHGAPAHGQWMVIQSAPLPADGQAQGQIVQDVAWRAINGEDDQHAVPPSSRSTLSLDSSLLGNGHSWSTLGNKDEWSSLGSPNNSDWSATPAARSSGAVAMMSPAGLASAQGTQMLLLSQHDAPQGGDNTSSIMYLPAVDSSASADTASKLVYIPEHQAAAAGSDSCVMYLPSGPAQPAESPVVFLPADTGPGVMYVSQPCIIVLQGNQAVQGGQVLQGGQLMQGAQIMQGGQMLQGGHILQGGRILQAPQVLQAAPAPAQHQQKVHSMRNSTPPPPPQRAQTQPPPPPGLPPGLEDPGQPTSRVFVGHLSPHMDESSLGRLFASCGRVLSAKVGAAAAAACVKLLLPV